MVTLGIAGTGGMAEYHVKKFRALEGVTITACKDRNRDHAEAFAQKFEIPRFFTSIGDLLAAHVCSAFSCAVIDSHHRELCQEVLEYGLPVFCEKPLSRTVKDSQILAALAQRRGLPTMVNFSKRNAPALGALKELVDSGEAGKLVSVKAEYLQSWVLTKVWGDWETVPRWKWRLSPKESTAGVIGDLGSHLVDALVYLFGDVRIVSEDPGHLISLESAVERHFSGDFVDSGRTVCVDRRASLVVGDGTPVDFHVSWIERNALDDFRLTVNFEAGTAYLDLSKSRAGIGYESALDHRIRPIPGREVRSTYEKFIDRCGSPFPTTPSDLDFGYALRIQRILDTLVPGGIV